jgi:hypothetical protein
LEYEFDVVADLTLDNDLVVSKTRCPDLRGLVVREAGADVAMALRKWLDDGEPIPSLEDYQARVLDPAITLDQLRAIRGEVVHHGYAQRLVDDGAGNPVPMVTFIDSRGRAMKATTELSRGELAAQEQAIAATRTNPKPAERGPLPADADPWAAAQPGPDSPAPATPLAGAGDPPEAPYTPADAWLVTWAQRLEAAEGAGKVAAVQAELRARKQAQPMIEADAEWAAALLQAKLATTRMADVS